MVSCGVCGRTFVPPSCAAQISFRWNEKSSMIFVYGRWICWYEATTIKKTNSIGSLFTSCVLVLFWLFSNKKSEHLSSFCIILFLFLFSTVQNILVNITNVRFAISVLILRLFFFLVCAPQPSTLIWSS